MILKTLPLGQIRPYPNNPRKNDDAVDAVIKSIEACSYVQPIVVDENCEILAGHTRYKALQALGYEEAEVIQVEGLTEEQKKKYRFFDNKTAETAFWDFKKLQEELSKIDFGEIDFFNLEDKDFEINVRDDFGSGIEFDTEDFEDEKFRYKCPHCGFSFD